MAGNAYRLAPAVEEIARKLIAEQKDFAPIKECGITVRAMFCENKMVSQGRPVLAASGLVGGKVDAMIRLLDLADPSDGAEWYSPSKFYLVMVPEPVWELLEPKQREALVHEQLCHLAPEKTEDGEWRVSFVAEDVRTFTRTMKAYGPWNADIERVVREAYAKQHTLDLAEDRRRRMNLAMLAAPILAALMTDPQYRKRSLPELSKMALDAASSLLKEQQARAAANN